MAVTLLVVAVLLVVLCLATWRPLRRTTPPELRGDWWSKFEADFRAYAERAGHQTRLRGPHEQPPPS